MRTHLFYILVAGSLLTGCRQPSAPAAQVQQEPAADVEKATPTAEAAAAPLATRPYSFADVVEQTRPAIVNIYTRTRVQTNRYFVTPNRRLIPEERLEQSLGSGFIIDDEGHVLTNFHVVANAADIEVRLFDERVFKARLVGEDPKTDVALLAIEGADALPKVELGDSDSLRVGDWVVAIGNPLGLTSTVTAGIVSATGRKSLPIGDLRYQDFIQTDASINPGNSGGALVDAEGRVIGVNTAINQGAQGIGFAIPINMILEILPKLKEGGRLQRSWLGIYVDPVPAALRAELKLAGDGGALVTKIVPGGPAEAAGLERGDVILGIGEDAVEDPDQLAWLAGNIGVGKQVALDVQRGHERLSVPLTLGALPE